MSDCEQSAMEEAMCKSEFPVDFSKECDIGALQAENKALRELLEKVLKICTEQDTWEGMPELAGEIGEALKEKENK